VRLASRRGAGVVRLERLVVHEGETLLDGATGAPVRLACTPDPALARRVTDGLRHLGWVRLHVVGDTAWAELFASSRHPVQRRIPLTAALALSEAGVPTLLVREPGQ
jgi:hypothetical protein